MSNSSLVNYVKISPNSTKPRNSTIKKITIHHMAGDFSVETCGRIFRERASSANYAVGSDGRVGMYVEEDDRAWTSSSRTNDNQAVTIEIANDMIGGEWHVGDVALNKAIDLCVDICKRNKIKKLNYTGDTKGNLTRHNMFANTQCPGPYLQSKFPYIVEEVNKKLSNKLADRSNSKADLRVDGFWGEKTTRALQKHFGTPVDGIISSPSILIKAIQKKVGARVDGYLGPETISKMQKHLGTTVDGFISEPSLMVKQMQRNLNSGKF